MRQVKESDFVGKTIVLVDSSAINTVYFKFSDGSEINLWGELIPLGVDYIPGIMIDEEE